MIDAMGSDVEWIEGVAVVGCDRCGRAVLAARSAARNALEDPAARWFAENTVATAVDYMVNHVESAHGGIPTVSPSARELRTLAAVAAAFDTLAENVGELSLDVEALDRAQECLGEALAAVPSELVEELREALAYAPPPIR